MPLNASIFQFEKKLKARTATTADRATLSTFINGARASEEDRVEGRRLLEEYDSMGPDAAKAGLVQQKQAQQHASAGPRGGGQRPPHRHGDSGAQAARRNSDAADPKVLGSPFHNPYTFIPFPKGSATEALTPTLLTADEVPGSDRFTGVLRVRVRALSPVLSCNAGAKKKDQPTDHTALRCGGRLIIPATGIRGALRHLMVVLTGGRLDDIAKGSWLCQGRDVNLGPRGPQTPQYPANCFLVRVEQPGSATRDGTVRLNQLSGANALIPSEMLGQHGVDERRDRPVQGKSRGVVVSSKDEELFIKLSGRPVHRDGHRDGLYRAIDSSDGLVTLPKELWAEYLERHRHADFPELKAGDLVWLEHRNPDADRISGPKDVVSIQWARWGRRGTPAMSLLGPASMRVSPSTDGSVDRATDLFGFIADGEMRAGRVRPDNLVFDEGTTITKGVEMAVMAQPHPSCMAFYRDIDDLDTVNGSTPLRGYKVYRTTVERGTHAPWLYKTQGVYDKDGELAPFAGNKMARRCDLINEGAEATVNIALRSLSRHELSLLLAMCGVDWRLGGGKPVGLGHCRPLRAELVDEDGETKLRWDIASRDDDLDRCRPTPVPADEAPTCKDEEFLKRLAIYQASQRPVKKLRYPRLIVDGSKGGHVWFQRFGTPRKNNPGLQVLPITGALQQQAGKPLIRAQSLPKFDHDRHAEDVLYGYDVRLTQVGQGLHATFDLAQDGGAGGGPAPAPGGPNHPRDDVPQGQNRERRQEQRRQRD